MERGAEAVYAAMNGRQGAPDVFARNCRWWVNGQDLSACTAPFGGPFLTIEQVRDREVVAVDEARGLIAYRTFEDLPALGEGYPLTYQVIDLFRFENGRIAEVQAYTSELPYGMQPHR
jgi:ketosteroid isomerase-like protein